MPLHAANKLVNWNIGHSIPESATNHQQKARFNSKADQVQVGKKKVQANGKTSLKKQSVDGNNSNRLASAQHVVQ